MNEKQLFEALGSLDDELIELSEKKTKTKKMNFLKFLIPAACLCLVTAVAIPFFIKSSDISTSSKGTSDTESVNKPTGSPTSDTYANLSELLEHLGQNESHDDTVSDSNGGYNVETSVDLLSDELKTGKSIVVTADGKYSYHLGRSEVSVNGNTYYIGRIFISKIDGEKTSKIGTIDISSGSMFIYDDYLIVGNTPYTYKEEMTESEFYSSYDNWYTLPFARFSVYDISDPEKPLLAYTYIQSGEITARWMIGKYLYFVSGDGQCACGYSNGDPDSYYPRSGFDGKIEPWGDNDISILGRPTRIQYSAISVIDITKGSVLNRQAVYGDIGKFYYSNNSVLLTVYSEDGYTDDIYSFDGNLDYAGKFNISDIVNSSISEKDKTDDAYRIVIKSIEHTDNSYRIIASCYSKTDSLIAAIDIDRKTMEAVTSTYNLTKNSKGDITEILWEETRAIIITELGEQPYSVEDKKDKAVFLFVEFTDDKITFYDTDVKGYLSRSRFSTHFGNSFGHFNTLISMGNDIYLRYTADEYAPKGFDIFDLSDSVNPRKLFESENMPGKLGGYDYFWHVYDSNTFGVLEVVQRNGEKFRNTEGFRWTVIEVDKDNDKPFTIISSTDIETEVFPYQDTYYDIGFEIIEINGVLFYTVHDPDSNTLKVLR